MKQAFPSKRLEPSSGVVELGLTKTEYYAAQLLQGMLAADGHNKYDKEYLISIAVNLAIKLRQRLEE